MAKAIYGAVVLERGQSSHPSWVVDPRELERGRRASLRADRLAEQSGQAPAVSVLEGLGDLGTRDVVTRELPDYESGYNSEVSGRTVETIQDLAAYAGGQLTGKVVEPGDQALAELVATHA